MSMIDWAKREVELACKREKAGCKEGEWDYGCACYESALKAYLSLCEDGHSGMSFSITRQILIRLMDGKTLTPIDDVPETWDLISEDDGIKEYQCNRAYALFKNVYPDGTVKYHDNESYYCKDINTGLSYFGGGAREIIEKYAKPITFPYIQPDKKYVLHTAEYLSDRKNGDFDTKAYLALDTPEGKHIVINEYYGEVDGKWKKLSKSEFDKRVQLHKEREALPPGKEKI